jgi:hypothetical protein
MLLRLHTTWWEIAEIPRALKTLAINRYDPAGRVRVVMVVKVLRLFPRLMLPENVEE